VDVIHSRAAFQRTDNATDMMINGDGFFIVAQQNMETGQWDYVYTRAGNFSIDNDGFLVNSQGLYVMGRTAELEMGVVSPGNEETPMRLLIRAEAFDGDEPPAAPGPGGGIPQSTRTGNTLPANFFRIGDEIEDGTFTGQPAGTYPMTITEDNINLWNNGDEWEVAAGRRWPANTRPEVATNPARPPIFGLVALPGNNGFDPGPEGLGNPDQYGLTRIRLTTTQIVLPLNPTTGLPTGYPERLPGESNADYTQRLYTEYLDTLTDTDEISLPGFAVADNGDISVIVGNRKVVIGQVALAMFANPAGLEKAGNSLYRESASSGPVVVTEAFMDGAGKIDGGGLEMSNVDLADQFTDMIVTQRGFQANSRIITVSDTMLEELVNLKR